MGERDWDLVGRGRRFEVCRWLNNRRGDSTSREVDLNHRFRQMHRSFLRITIITVKKLGTSRFVRLILFPTKDRIDHIHFDPMRDSGKDRGEGD